MALGYCAASEKWDLGLEAMAVLTPRKGGILPGILVFLDLYNDKLVGFWLAILNY